MYLFERTQSSPSLSPDLELPRDLAALASELTCNTLSHDWTVGQRGSIYEGCLDELVLLVEATSRPADPS